MKKEMVKALVLEKLKQHEMYSQFVNAGPENMSVSVDEHDKTKLNITFDAPIHDIDIDVKYAFSAELMWQVRLMGIGGCRLPRGMQKGS